MNSTQKSFLKALVHLGLILKDSKVAPPPMVELWNLFFIIPDMDEPFAETFFKLETWFGMFTGEIGAFQKVEVTPAIEWCQKLADDSSTVPNFWAALLAVPRDK